MGHGNIQWDPPLTLHWSDISLKRALVTELVLITDFDRITKLRENSIKHFATGAASKQRILTPPDTWSCSILGLAFVLVLRPFSPKLVMSPDFEYRTLIGTSILLHSQQMYSRNKHCLTGMLTFAIPRSASYTSAPTDINDFQGLTSFTEPME